METNEEKKHIKTLNVKYVKSVDEYVDNLENYNGESKKNSYGHKEVIKNNEDKYDKKCLNMFTKKKSEEIYDVSARKLSISLTIRILKSLCTKFSLPCR